MVYLYVYYTLLYSSAYQPPSCSVMSSTLSFSGSSNWKLIENYASLKSFWFNVSEASTEIPILYFRFDYMYKLNIKDIHF